jgi:CO/xanthine dehydrogenase Mo-binding subunit
MEIELVENPFAYGPYGAKCAGELPFVGVAPALAAAVQCALGIPVQSIPVTPESLLEGLGGKEHSVLSLMNPGRGGW